MEAHEMTVRLRTAARRLMRRAEDYATNSYKMTAPAVQKDPPDIEEYNKGLAYMMKRQQEALDEFHAAVTGKCPCGEPVAYPTKEELSDGKAVSRYCKCGRNFVIG